MPGDLNVKKSWHPALAKNRARVQAQEQKALAERQRIQERQAEIAKENEIKELRAMRGLAPSSKLGWMYQSGSSSVSDLKQKADKIESTKSTEHGDDHKDNQAAKLEEPAEQLPPNEPPPKESQQSTRRKQMADPMADLLGPNKKAVAKKTRKQRF